jgi:hypothetical protein
LAILAAYAALGLQVKFKKSVITPTTLIRHLGLDLDVCNRRILPPPDKIKRMSTLVKRLLSSSARQRRFVSKLYLAKVVGFAQSLTLALPFGRHMLADAYECLNTKPGWNNVKVKLSNTVISILNSYWACLQLQTLGRPWGPPESTLILGTDACRSGWGAHAQVGDSVHFY